MTKQDFLKELESLLSDIPLEERKEALNYYDAYFEDAGCEQEEEILKELVSPSKVAASIKASLNANEQEIKSRGYFTEKGYEDESLKDPKLELVRGNIKNSKDQEKEKDSQQRFRKEGREYYNSNYDKNNNYRKENNKHMNYRTKDNSASRVILIILLCIFAIPVGIPIIATALFLAFAVIITIGAFWLALAILSVSLIFAGVILAVVGVIKIIGIPAVGFFMVGSGIFLIGVGILCCMATVGCFRIIPTMFHSIVNLCKIPFQRRRVSA